MSPNSDLCFTPWLSYHDDVIKWKLYPRHWPFVRGIHRSPVTSPHNGQWRRALMFSLIYAWINDWVNNGEAGDLGRYRTHYVVTLMHTPYRFIPERVIKKADCIPICNLPQLTLTCMYTSQRDLLLCRKLSGEKISNFFPPTHTSPWRLQKSVSLTPIKYTDFCGISSSVVYVNKRLYY